MNPAYYRIKPATIAAIRAHADRGEDLDNEFVNAALTNDLKETFAQADDDNILVVREVVMYLYNEIPGSCWGSREKVIAWRRERAAAREEVARG